MKYSILLILAIKLITTSNLRAQNGFCGTPNDFANEVPYQEPSQNFSGSSIRVRIFVHIIRRSNGTGGRSFSSVFPALVGLKDDLEPHNICISLYGVDFINNDNYFSNFDNLKFSSLININYQSNCINIYVLPDSEWNQGRASGIPGTKLVLGGSLFGVNLFNSHVLAHEIGHCLGLFHTHQGTQSGSSGCKELVNSTNCTTCGDYVCDTPADPGLNFGVNQVTCIWGGSGSDANGTPYIPDTRNIMSYTQPQCMSYFSAGQGSRMFSALINNSLLQNCKIPDAERISPLLVSSGESLVYNLKNSLELANTQSSGSLLAEAGVKVAVTKNSRIQGNFRGRINYDCSITNIYNSARKAQSQDEISQKDNLNQPEANGLFKANIYPNPINNFFNIQISDENISILSVDIYNFQGALIYSVLANEIKQSKNYLVNSSGWPTGYYQVAVRLYKSNKEFEKIFRFPIIKQ